MPLFSHTDLFQLDAMDYHGLIWGECRHRGYHEPEFSSSSPELAVFRPACGDALDFASAFDLFAWCQKTSASPLECGAIRVLAHE